jgi:hypothetical protein
LAAPDHSRSDFPDVTFCRGALRRIPITGVGLGLCWLAGSQPTSYSLPALTPSPMQGPQGLELTHIPAYQSLEFWTLVVAAVALAASIYAIVVSKRTARRTGVIELHRAWADVNELEPSNLIGPDVRTAVNALDLTASLWNHDVIDKNILFQSYWQSFKDTFEILSNTDRVVPGYRRTARECLTPSIRKAYQDMQKWELKLVRQTRL